MIAIVELRRSQPKNLFHLFDARFASPFMMPQTFVAHSVSTL